MKRHFITLLIISVICIIASFVLFRLAPTEVKTNKTSQILNERESKYGEEIDDVEGYEYLINLIGAITIDTASVFTKLFILIIPVFLLFLIAICQIISGLIQLGKDKKWKRITSKIFTYTSSFILIILCLFLLQYLIKGHGVGKSYIFIVLVLNIICLIMHIITLVKTNKKNPVQL